MEENLDKQYNPLAEQYAKLHLGQNEKSKRDFFENIEVLVPHKNNNLLDLGCGAGNDFDFYESLGFKCHGIDASGEMCELARRNHPRAEISEGRFDQDMPFPDNAFGMIVSTWAMQTAPNIENIYEEVERLLVKEGYFAFLTVHPIRQFLEKKRKGKNYFEQEIVASEIFNKRITVHEPTHTLQEYLSPCFLGRFEVLEVKEGYEFPAAEQIGGDIYPTYLIVVAQKK